MGDEQILFPGILHKHKAHSCLTYIKLKVVPARVPGI